MLNVATWNVRGLSKSHKQSLLSHDCSRYHLDIVCLQETKCTVLSDQRLAKFRLIIMQQKNSYHGGLGFILSPKVQPWIKSYTYLSDRVAFLDIQIPSKGGGEVNYRIINAYGPTQPRATADPLLATAFYRDLTRAYEVPSRYEVYFAGDFNAKLGKLTAEERASDVSRNVGRYAVGTRNSNGERLLNFLAENDMFACNTAFQHPSRHITTRTGWVKDRTSSKPRATKPVYSQIDYILCRTRSKRVLRNARSYAGASLDSDHKIVVATIDIGKPYLLHRVKSRPTRYNVSCLTSSKNTQLRYGRAVSSHINVAEYETTANPTTKLRSLMNVVKKTAVDVIGIRKPTRNSHHSDDSLVVSLAEERRQLRLKLNHNISADRTLLRSKINRLQKRIQQRIKQLKCDAADHLVRTISSTDESRRMFEAVRNLTNSKPARPITVHNVDGHVIAGDEEKAEVVKSWFEQHYTGDEPALEPFEGVARPLNVPISTTEVELAIKRLKNNRATGPDEIPNELLKYAGTSFCIAFSRIINQCFETHTYIDAIGESILTPLQKPGKPLGPVKNLRPLNLLNGVRKILSVLTLGRIQDQVNNYTGPWQCGYKAGHGCADIVWSQQMLISVVKRKHFDFHKMGIDMTSAFDTIKRSTILRLLEDAGCSEDDVRLVRMLLANTKVTVRVNMETSTVFLSTRGAFQGDSLSGCLFTLSFAGSLYHMRAVCAARPIIPIADGEGVADLPEGLPLEWEYSDDADFVDVNLNRLKSMLPVCTSVLREWDLNVNEGKTEFVHFYLAARGDVDSDGKALVDNEPWRFSKSLGSLLCSSADIKHRIVLANSAFQTYSKVWLQPGSKLPLERKLLVYEAQVISVLLYNCGCWSAPKAVLSKLDTCSRKHLRKIVQICWPKGVISNEELYRRCQAVPITERVRRARWTLLGHVLRMDDNAPPVLSMRFAIAGAEQYGGRLGRPRTNLLGTIRGDLKQHNISLKTVDDFNNLRQLASDRSLWKSMFRM